MVKNLCKKEIKFTVYTIVKCKNEILLLHRTEDLNVWEFPGGKIEFGESPYETAVRELKEEVGIENKNIELFDVTSVIYPDGKTMQVSIFFLLEIPKKVSPFLSEHKEFKWITIKEAVNLNLALSVLSIIKKLQKIENNE
jgi:dATP pyrophosphohydrolase